MTQMFTVVSQPTSAELVPRIEKLLADAKAGKISAIAFAITYPDGNTGSGWSRVPNVSLLVGAVARLQHKLCLEE